MLDLLDLSEDVVLSIVELILAQTSDSIDCESSIATISPELDNIRLPPTAPLRGLAALSVVSRDIRKLVLPYLFRTIRLSKLALWHGDIGSSSSHPLARSPIRGGYLDSPHLTRIAR